MRKSALALGFAALLGAAGCDKSASQRDEPQQLAPELASLVLDEAPSDVPNRTLMDFAGKADLIGYSVTPSSLAAPGSKLSLKTFWRSSGRLGEGYQLYTELVTPAGKRFEIEGAGPLRKGPLTPSNWQPGKIYIDELEITVPQGIDAARFSIVVGLKTTPIEPEPVDDAKAERKPAEAEEKASGTFDSVYLSVVSGLADPKHGGIIATLETGITPGAMRARNVKPAAAQGKRPPGALGQLPQLKPGQPVRMPSPPPPGSAR